MQHAFIFVPAGGEPSGAHRDSRAQAPGAWGDVQILGMVLERFPVMTVTYCALVHMLEKFPEETDKARIMAKARLTELFVSGGKRTRCICEKGGASLKEYIP